MITYETGTRFNYNGTTYQIKTAKENATAIEIASHQGQSLWVSIPEFERLLGITGKTGLFHWHIAQRKTAHL